SDSTELAEVHEYAGEGVRRLIVSRLIPFFVIAISFAIWMKLKIQTGEQVTTQVDLIYRPFIALDSISFYIQKLVWPFGLAFDYGRTPFSVLHSGAIWKTWILPTLIWIALVAFAWKRNRLWPWLAAALFIIPIIPVLGLTKFEFMDYSTVSDHYVYSSMLGVAVLFAFCVERCGRVAPPVSIVILVLLGLRSFDQTHNWKDGKSVALQTLRIDPDSWPTWGNLAGWHLDRGEFEDAERAARRSLELRPLEEKNRVSAFNLAAVMVNTNRHTEAIPLLVKVVRAEPNNVQYRLALAEAYAAVGRHADAIRQFEAARHFEPTNERALKGLAEMNRLEGDRQSTQPSTAPTTTPAQGEP
ncbi:MAG TPA: tetratricopeptide repeat protein, partial [Tepidisphaeraceae bacterium]|nr:tetratricopeptide repeat protein [Tepidisphaeraceae bacterium]